MCDIRRISVLYHGNLRTTQCYPRRIEEPNVSKAQLPLKRLADRHDGLTEAVAESYTEAARVCLDRHYESPVDFAIHNAGTQTDAVTEWERTDDRTRRAWANEIDTTEAGAYACVLAAVELSHKLVAVHRAETKKGADYYVAPEGTLADDLETCIRLEISGVDGGTMSAVSQRLKQKLEQARAGQSNLPAMAGVVGFHARVVLLAALDES